jgi:arginine decarboxylase
MRDKYIDLIEQTYDFPPGVFAVENDCLHFNGIDLMSVIEEYGSPLKISYLPRISERIQEAKRMFRDAMDKTVYPGEYKFAYCTKSSHFSFVMEEVLKNDVHVEISSTFDIDIVERLAAAGNLSKDRYILCNGYKMDDYLERIVGLLRQGFVNTLPILDNTHELDQLIALNVPPCKVGIRIASEESAIYNFYTSRFGIRYNEIVPFYQGRLRGNKNLRLTMLHFFINTGIQDTAYYWNELAKSVEVYCQLRKVCPTLNALNIGGGLPFQHALDFRYDYGFIIEEIVQQIKSICDTNNVPCPDIFTEFGSFTVGESGAAIYRIIGQKRQNDRELWNFIDSSFITTLPDTWGTEQKFILMAVNHWDKQYERVFLGGITCDGADFYFAEAQKNSIFLPKFQHGEPLYIALFHTGAYQEALAGYGGIQHCLIPHPKHVVAHPDETGKIRTELFAKEQTSDSMMRILGYGDKHE